MAIRFTFDFTFLVPDPGEVEEWHSFERLVPMGLNVDVVSIPEGQVWIAISIFGPHIIEGWWDVILGKIVHEF